VTFEEVEKLKVEIVRIRDVIFYINFFLDNKPSVNGPIDSAADYAISDKESWTQELNKKLAQLKYHETYST